MRLALPLLVALVGCIAGCADVDCSTDLRVMLEMTVLDANGNAVLPESLEMVDPEGRMSDVTHSCGEATGVPRCAVTETFLTGRHRVVATYQGASAELDETWDGDEYGCHLERKERTLQLP